ncbi:MAG TPA: nuclear transport factor 2 family protein [Flavisolibacter sp.]|nr:nuclear transport factor 2 family protein [Flavisolibacter sp.]
MKKTAVLLLILWTSGSLHAQLPPSPDSNYLLSLNQRIDDLVMQQQTAALDSLYAQDFVFSHGSGRIEGKGNWLRTVGRTRYPIRRHDSVRVQQHGDLAVLRGKMYIERTDKTKTARYHLRYIRIYALRANRWQLISHTTTEERHEEGG